MVLLQIIWVLFVEEEVSNTFSISFGNNFFYSFQFLKRNSSEWHWKNSRAFKIVQPWSCQLGGNMSRSCDLTAKHPRAQLENTNLVSLSAVTKKKPQCATWHAIRLSSFPLWFIRHSAVWVWLGHLSLENQHSVSVSPTRGVLVPYRVVSVSPSQLQFIAPV